MSYMSKTISFILTILIIITLTVNIAVAAENPLDELIQKGNDIINNVKGNINAGLWDITLHWAKSNIEILVNKGAISGYPDGTFRPEASITRAEFTKILLAAMGSNPGNAKSGHWADNYIKEAVIKGYLISGEFDNFDIAITRSEIAMMIVRAQNETYPDNMNDFTKQIKDYNLTPAKYQEYIKKAYVTGIITGYSDGTFGYSKKATRAEASTMIVRLIDTSKRKIPELSAEGRELAVMAKKIPNMVMPNDNIAMYKADGIAKAGQNDFAISTEENYDYYISINNYKDSTLEALKEALKVIYTNDYTTAYNKLVQVCNGKIGPLGKPDYQGYIDGRYTNIKKYENGIGMFMGKRGVKY